MGKRHGTGTLEADVLPRVLINPGLPLVWKTHVATVRAHELIMVRTFFQVLTPVKFMNELVIHRSGYF